MDGDQGGFEGEQVVCTILKKEQRGNLGELAEDVLGKANGLQTRVDRDRREVSSERSWRGSG